MKIGINELNPNNYRLGRLIETNCTTFDLWAQTLIPYLVVPITM